MPWLPFRLRRRVTADDRARDLDREIRSHLELEAEEQRLDGASPDEARWAARRAFGNPLLIAEDGRAVWGRPALEACVQDLRYGVRLMRRSPVFSIVAVASSALGIGACAVIAALLNTVLLEPLPVDAPDRLMHVSELDRRSGEAGNELSYLDFRDLQQRTRIFDGVAAANYMLPAAIGAEDDPQRQWGALVTANYFDVVRPVFLLGRGFDRGRDDVRGAPPVIVLSHDLWRGRFNADRGIVGRDVSVNGKVATVIGVTADGFAGTQLGFASAFWIPFSMLDEVEGRSGPVTQNRRRFWLDVVARLPDGATLASAQSELEDLGRVIDKEFPRPTERVFQAERAGQIDARLRGLSGTMIAIGFGLTGLVLAAACANVANLLLGRASARRREIAARMALGASRARLVRQLVTESVLLAGIGGLGGVLIAVYVTSLFSRLRAPLGWPIDLSVALDLSRRPLLRGAVDRDGPDVRPRAGAARDAGGSRRRSQGRRGRPGATGPACASSRAGRDAGRDVHGAPAVLGTVPAKPAGGARSRSRARAPEPVAARARSRARSSS